MRRLMVLAGSVAVVLVGVGAASPVPQTQATQGRWVIRDLGTLGGRESGAIDINEDGQIIGWAETKRGDGHAVLWEKGKVRDLGTLGGPESEAEAINERGQIVGNSDTKTKGEFGIPISHAFLWEKGKMTDLGTPRCRSENPADAINERGQVAGTCSAGATAASERHYAFLWQNGRLRDLGTLGGPNSSTSGVNERGQVVGVANNKATDEFDQYRFRAFVWQNGKMRDLGTFGGPESSASAINDRGQVVGEANTKASYISAGRQYVSHPFLWQNGKMRDLGVLTDGGRHIDVFALNERGQAVGWAETNDGSSHAVLWENGTVRDLGTLGGNSWANAVNDRGQIVGNSDTKPMDADGDPIRHAFFWQKGKMRDLGTLGGPRSRSVGFAINERGQIVGSSSTKSGRSHAVLWTFKP